MSVRDTADQLNLSSRAASAVRSRYPDESLLFSSAVTILETPTATPTGWSLRRLLQRRGNVVITSERIFIQSSLVSPLTLIWLVAIAFGAYKVINGGAIPHIVLPIVGAFFIFQRRPYLRDIQVTKIQGVQFGAVQGMAARCDILSIDFGSHAIQLVTSQTVPDTVRVTLQQLSPRGDAQNATA
jgi:hypothetical protein